MASVDITLPDSSTSTVSLFPAQGKEKPLVVVWPGFGMGARYYTPISEWLSERGFPVAIGELRGQGTSTARATRSSTWGYHNLVTEDYPLTISAAKDVLGLPANHPVALLTHSMGGQVGILYLSSSFAREQNAVGMMGVGTGSPYWKSFTGRSRRRIGLGAPVMSGVSRTLGFWPAGRLDLAGYGRQAGRHVREWARLSRTNEIGHIAGADYPAAVTSVQVPVLLTRFANDEDCTVASAEALVQHVPAAEATVEQLDGGLGHNRWARDPEVVGRRFVRFYEEKLA